MKIALGNDHAGFLLKEYVRTVLENLGHEVFDCGAPNEAPVDFPDITRATCELVKTGQAERAILVCGTGAGAVMAANKIPGIRCALGHDVYSAHQSVEHDDANAMAMGAWLISRATAQEVLQSFLDAKFDNDENTIRRVQKLRDIELDAARELAIELWPSNRIRFLSLGSRHTSLPAALPSSRMPVAAQSWRRKETGALHSLQVHRSFSRFV